MNFTSWCQNINDILPLRAVNYNDTIAYAKIPVSYIKKANVKLIERKFYIELNNQKDSIINYKNQYINAQRIIINDLSNDYCNIKKLNDDIKNDLDRQKVKIKVFEYTTIGLISLILITALMN